MARIRTPARRRVARLALIASMILGLAAPVCAGAAPAAIDEYSLGSVGSNQTTQGEAPQDINQEDAAATRSLGVIGEDSAPESTLSSSWTQGGTPWVLAGALALSVGVSILIRRSAADAR